MKFLFLSKNTCVQYNLVTTVKLILEKYSFVKNYIFVISVINALMFSYLSKWGYVKFLFDRFILLLFAIKLYMMVFRVVVTFTILIDSYVHFCTDLILFILEVLFYL